MFVWNYGSYNVQALTEPEIGKLRRRACVIVRMTLLTGKHVPYNIYVPTPRRKQKLEPVKSVLKKLSPIQNLRGKVCTQRYWRLYTCCGGRRCDNQVFVDYNIIVYFPLSLRTINIIFHTQVINRYKVYTFKINYDRVERDMKIYFLPTYRYTLIAFLARVMCFK